MHKKLLILLFIFLGYNQIQAQSSPDSLVSIIQNKGIVQQDLIRVLSGMQAGLKITATGGLSGSGTNAIIRGYSSLNAGTDPLIIVDGIRLDSRNNQNSSAFTGGGTLTTPNRSLDINPSEIVKVEVLNNLAATIRYGEEARNGVILVSTNRSENLLAEDHLELSYQQGVYSTQIGSRPDYQDQFGMGFNGLNSLTYSSWGAAFNPPVESNIGVDFLKFDTDGTVLIEHPILSHAETAAEFLEFVDNGYRYEAKPTAIDDFFNNGFSSSSIFGAKYRSGEYLLNVNYAGSWEDGFTPGNELRRNNFGASFSYPLLEKVQGRSTLQLAYTNTESPVLSAGGGSGRVQNSGAPSVLSDVFYTPRSLGFDIPFQNPQTGGSAYYRPGNDILNPRWTVENSKTLNNSNRIYGSTEVLFDPSEKFNILYRYTFESYDENQEYRLNPSLATNYPFPTGLYQTQDVSRTFYEQLLLAELKDSFNSDLFLRIDFGLSYISEEIEEKGLESTDIRELGVFKHDNFRAQIPISSFTNELFSREFDRRTFSVFSIANLDFKNLFFTEIGIRGDFNNSLQQQDLNAWYPAIQLSYTPTNHFDDQLGPVSSTTISVGYFTSGRSIFTEEEILVQNRASVRVNNDIKPERSIEKQVGLELGFFNERFKLKSEYFQRIHTDLISRISDDTEAAFSSILDNLMEIESEGLEMSFLLIPIQSELQWSINGNFSTIKTEVKDYTGSFNAIQLGNSLSNRGNAALIDEPFMIMYGSKILKVDRDLIASNPNFRNVPVGTPIIDQFGNYITGEVGIIGNPVPKWNASMIHQLTFKNLGISIQLDYQRGGDMYSTWIASLLGRGVITETTKNDRTETYVIEGVGLDGSPNDIEIGAQQYFFNNIGFGSDQARVFDMTHFRISHIGLDYNLPDKWFQNSRIHQVRFSISVENAFLHMPNVPESTGFDPNVNSNGAGVNNMGFEYLTGPSARRIGGAVRLKF